jgi:hypothetical protein
MALDSETGGCERPSSLQAPLILDRTYEVAPVTPPIDGRKYKTAGAEKVFKGISAYF